MCVCVCVCVCVIASGGQHAESLDRPGFFNGLLRLSMIRSVVGDWRVLPFGDRRDTTTAARPFETEEMGGGRSVTTIRQHTSRAASGREGGADVTWQHRGARERPPPPR